MTKAFTLPAAVGACAISVVLALTLLRGDYDQSPLSRVNSEIIDPLTEDLRKLDAIVDQPDVLNVHLVPHTHDDVGWLKTVEEYYYGLNMTIQKACVRNILDSVVVSLLKNPSRTFTYVEQKFFSMWWGEQSKAVKDSVRSLVANKQLSFVNGGWCMHDEATAHFMGMIDQTTLGHQFLKQELGVIPKVGWQLDPFGHSATQASLLTARAGMDALYFGRVDYEDLQIRHDTQECEGLWSASNDTIFWGLTGSYNGQYECPKGFCFDVLCHDKLLVDMNRTELVGKMTEFVQELKVQSDRTKGNHIMITMGGDFTYRFAESFFNNNDLLMQSLHTFQQWSLINIPSILGPRFQKIHIFYSSPDYYTEMKHMETMVQQASASPEIDNNHLSNVSRQSQDTTASGINWTVKTDDFFPYADCPHCYWTGYFTSRAGFKRLERVSSAFLLASRQIESFPDNVSSTNEFSDSDNPLFDLEDASGVAQHHDAVSGTAMQHVANDYSKRLQAGINKAAIYVEQKLRRLLANASDGSNALENLRYCQLLNESVCEVSQEATKENAGTMHVVIYNALGSNRSQIVQLPVSSDGLFAVSRLGSQSAEVADTTVFRTVPSPFGNGHSSASAKYVLTFDTGPLTPVGATVFRIIRSPSRVVSLKHSNSGRPDGQSSLVALELRSLQSQKDNDDDAEDAIVSNEFLAVRFDRGTGEMLAISTNDTALNVSQSWGYYTSFDKRMDKTVDNSSSQLQNSGAYIFRPSTPSQGLQILSYQTGKVNFVNTSVGTEVHVEFGEPWIKQVTRVMKGLPYVEVEYSIGPIPIEDGRGREVVTRFSTPIKSNSIFFTDSNGREFLERRRNYRPSWNLTVHEPVAGNYYPVNAAMYIEDGASSFALLTDRTQAGASLIDGSVELMAQRRVLADDSRGVREPMNETNGEVTPYPPFGKAQRWGEGVVIRGTYRILVGKGKSGASLARSEMDHAFAPPLVFVASSPSSNASVSIRGSFSVLREALPPNVMLVTFKRMGGKDSNDYLIRLGHQYGENEDKELSQPVAVDFANLFVGFKDVSAEELTLTGNQKFSEWLKTRLSWVRPNAIPGSSISVVNTTVTLQPMEVRTFAVTMGNV